MTERERLIELLEKVKFKPFDACNIMHNLNIIADELLANGVIVPPCKVGDVVYSIHNGKVFGGKVIVIYIFESHLAFAVSGGGYFREDDFGKTVFLTKEEAEQALGGGKE